MFILLIFFERSSAMVLKTRAKPKELLVMKALEARMDLSIKQKQYFQALERGYDGEVLFDSLIEKLECECIILNDLLLNFNNTTFQIDSLIITSNKIYIFEIKNYEGDYLYEADSLFTINKKEIINQIGRASCRERVKNQAGQR